MAPFLSPGHCHSCGGLKEQVSRCAPGMCLVMFLSGLLEVRVGGRILGPSQVSKEQSLSASLEVTQERRLSGGSVEFQGSLSFPCCQQGSVALLLTSSLRLRPHSPSSASAARHRASSSCQRTQPPLKLLNGAASNLFLWPAPTTGHRAKRCANSTGHDCRANPKRGPFTGPRSGQLSAPQSQEG